MYKRTKKSSLNRSPFNMYEIIRDDFRGNMTFMDTTNWLAAPLISILNPSIFRVGCNAINSEHSEEGMIIHQLVKKLASLMKQYALVSSGQKYQVKGRERFCKDNSDRFSQ